MKPLRKLNDEGLAEFETWIADGGVWANRP